jgi:plasmid stabilization system protein ParE
MRLRWSSNAASDLVRLSEFLRRVNPAAAARPVIALTKAPERLLSMPRLGEPLERFAPREVRRLLVNSYEIHYEVSGNEILIIRVWHTREER